MERLIRRFAGAFILLSVGLGYWVSPYWFLFTAFVGVNLLQSSLTGWCPLEIILQRFGIDAPGSTRRS
jgi:Inner membrane protein YgaP-like, transmembrane domain